VSTLKLYECFLTACHSYIYGRQIVYDGNFSAQLFKQKHPEDDVQLSDGSGFMVSRERYQEHLKVAKTMKQVSESFS
jgi:hypothetical protein